MAISGGDGSIILTTKVDETGLKKGLVSLKRLGATAGKAFLAIGAAAGAATVAITKMAVSAYADYEQLVGGVETLFKDSAGKVLEYANQAFATTGQSANEYMQNVTAFSASLLSAVGGDTERAAEVANAAMISISDNVNKMGSTAESVQLAFQGFAKQQYMLLDNLKLGYGGTKTEMERLLKDAQAITGVEYNIDNLADVYTAIGVIQEKLGIAGTTAKEAESTISGSASMMKAAWQNVLSAIAGGGDLDRAINNLVYSVQKYFENIVPVVERSLAGIGRLIEQVAPMLVQNVASALIQAIPSLINAIYQMIIGLAKGIYQGIKVLFTGGSGSVTADIKTSVGGIATEAENASTGMEELGDATEKAGKQAKKSLAAFDELNILSNDESGGAGSGETPEIAIGGIGGGGIDLGLTDSFDKTTENSADFANNIKGIFESIKNKVSGYLSLFEPTKEAWGGAFDTISASLDDANVNFAASGESAINTLDTFGTYILEEFIPPVSNGLSTDLLPLLSDVAGFTLEEAGKQFEWYGEFIESATSDIILPALETFKGDFTDKLDGVGKAWEEHGDFILKNLGEVLDGLRQNWDTFYKEVLKPVADKVNQFVKEIWEENLKPLWDKLVDAVLSISGELLVFWNQVLKPILAWILQKIYPIISQAVDNILTTLRIFFQIASGIAIGLIDVIKGIIQFIVGVFTVDWKKAWVGLKNIFVGITNSIINTFENMVNFVISGTNKLIDGLNGLTNKAGSVIGLDVRIPKIPEISLPRLAQGTVVPPNREFLAVLGDNKKEHEIVSPLSTMKQAFLEALMTTNINGGQDNRPIILQIDGREIARATREGDASLGSQTVFGGFANAY
jgi:hypothetical protein